MVLRRVRVCVPMVYNTNTISTQKVCEGFSFRFIEVSKSVVYIIYDLLKRSSTSKSKQSKQQHRPIVKELLLPF